jgi:hypothetical protein
MKNYFLYIILWLGGCVIAVLIAILWSDKNQSEEIILFGNNQIVIKEVPYSGSIVSQLLLSAGEMDIYSSPLISPGILQENKNKALSKNNSVNADEIYDKILKAKIRNANRASNRDFYIKPVPK